MCDVECFMIESIRLCGSVWCAAFSGFFVVFYSCIIDKVKLFLFQMLL